jgi:hypothetical protein
MAKLSSQLSGWVKASELELKQAEYRYASLELPNLKPFIPSGLQRGSLVEITGLKSSGRTSTSLYILAVSISKGEACACIDLNDQFDPTSLSQIGIDPGRLSWVRCHGNTEHAMRSADLLLHAGGFGVVLLDLCGASPQALNRIPLSYWFRFQRAIEDTPTILLICGERPQARSCARQSLEVKARKIHWVGEAPFATLEALESSAVASKALPAKVTSIRPESLFIQTPRIQTMGA